MNERAVAANVLLEAEEGAYLNIALKRALDKLDSEHRALNKGFITELAAGTMRNKLLIDHIIDGHIRKRQKMRPIIRAVLRCGVYQMGWMNVPDSAAVNEAVKLVRKMGLGNLSGFVNGLLRNIGRDTAWHVCTANPLRQEDAHFADTAHHDPVPLHLKYSFPFWLAEKLTGWLGASEAENFMALTHKPPVVTVCPNPLKISRPELLKILQDSGADCIPSETTPCIHLRNLSSITGLAAFRDGLFHVMDEGAYLAAAALSPRPGQLLIDLCAAPGGKAFAAMGMMQNSGTLIACDIHAHKLKLLENGAARLGFQPVTDCNRLKTGTAPANGLVIQHNDAAQFRPEWEAAADAVLLDAPCTGLGIIRKRPDIKYSKNPADIEKLAALQLQMLQTAARYVKLGGNLVYSTCTVSPEENQHNIASFLAGHSFTEEESTALPPGEYNDGFFIARLRRVG